MSIFHEASDALSEVDPETDELTVDQKLKYAEVKALLAIAQNLSIIHHQGVNPEFDGSL